jgi:hypothetical protein
MAPARPTSHRVVVSHKVPLLAPPKKAPVVTMTK